jgi:hypothetical protein
MQPTIDHTIAEIGRTLASLDRRQNETASATALFRTHLLSRVWGLNMRIVPPQIN